MNMDTNESLSVESISNSTKQYKLLYEIYLMYMYEGDMNEDQYWEVLIQTSTPEGLRKYATKVHLNGN